MNWRLAARLAQLRSELDTKFPLRDRTSDGAIGDAAHASRSSDHNPWVHDHLGQPIVTAIDVDRDLAPGIDVGKIAEWMRLRRDPSIKYVIYARRMFASYDTPARKAWAWGPYIGSNAHTEHMHISVVPSEIKYDDMSLWGIGAAIESAPVVPIPPPPPFVPATRPTLRLGSAGKDVGYLQRMLGGGLVADNEFGPKTKAAVMAFQTRVGLDASGTVDEATWTTLEK